MILEPVGEIPLPAHHGPGGFDHAAVHRSRRQLYVAHTANNTLDVIDCEAGKYLRSIPHLEAVAGALVSEEHDLVFTSNRGENTVGIFSADHEEALAKVAGRRETQRAGLRSRPGPSAGRERGRPFAPGVLHCLGRRCERPSDDRGRPGVRPNPVDGLRCGGRLLLCQYRPPGPDRRDRKRQSRIEWPGLFQWPPSGHTGWTWMRQPTGCSARATAPRLSCSIRGRASSWRGLSSPVSQMSSSSTRPGGISMSRSATRG